MARLRLSAAAAKPRPWARRARALNPAPTAAHREATQLRADIPEALRRMTLHGHPTGLRAQDLSRLALTRLQTQLRTATEISPAVAQDEFLQQFRKHLHLLLDH